MRPKVSTDPESGSRRRLNRLTALVCLLVLVDTVFYSALTPLVPHYSRATGLGNGGVGVLVAAYPVGTLVASLPAGALFDRFGARRTLLVAMALMSASTLTFGWSSAAAVLIGARLVQGVGGACAWTAGLAALSAEAPAAERGRYMGVAFSAAVAGAIVGPALGAVAAHLGTGPVFSAAALLAVVICAFRGLLPPSAEQQSVRVREVLAVARRAGIAHGLWLTALAGIGLGMLNVLGPLRLNSLGASAGLIAAAFIGGGIAEAVLAPFIGHLSDRHGPRYTVTRSLYLCVVASILVPLVTPKAIALAAVALGSLAFGTLFVPAAAMVSQGADEHGAQHGMVFGLTNLLWATGQGSAAGVSGFVADATSDKVPLFAAAVICLLSLVANQAVSRRADRPTTQE
jgi:MFS family permease